MGVEKVNVPGGASKSGDGSKHREHQPNPAPTQPAKEGPQKTDNGDPPHVDPDGPQND